MASAHAAATHGQAAPRMNVVWTSAPPPSRRAATDALTSRTPGAIGGPNRALASVMARKQTPVTASARGVSRSATVSRNASRSPALMTTS